ncbi:MAG: hypothetical protein H6594_04290 [Flavobacteriales bacterium]|nr:hypothetical protein [Flavobacteriales bacterium]
MRRGKIILIVLVVLGAIAGIYGLWEYDRGLTDASDEKPVDRLDAVALLNAFTNDESAANAKYNGHAVQVSGLVKDASGPENGKMTVMLDTGDPLSMIVCEFDDPAMTRPVPGSQLTVKGFCAGFNLDVLLQRCVIVE